MQPETSEEFKYYGKVIPKQLRSSSYKYGRLPESERTGELPGHGEVRNATIVSVTPSNIVAIDKQRRESIHSYIRGLNKMFTQVNANEIPAAKRKGKAAKDYGNDPVFKALKDMPNGDAWHTDGKEYTKDNAAKFQSRISAYAKAGAGTFKTSHRSDGKVYIQKLANEYTRQRGADESEE